MIKFSFVKKKAKRNEKGVLSKKKKKNTARETMLEWCSLNATATKLFYQNMTIVKMNVENHLGWHLLNLPFFVSCSENSRKTLN